MTGTLRLSARLNGKDLPVASQTVQIDSGQQQVRATYDLGPAMQRWDEFSPSVYELTAEFVSSDAKQQSRYQTSFGVWQLSNENSLLHINGRRLFPRAHSNALFFR